MAYFFVTLSGIRTNNVIMSVIDFIIKNSDTIYGAVTHILLLFIAFKKK
jgi:hypothetical protein